MHNYIFHISSRSLTIAPAVSYFIFSRGCNSSAHIVLFCIPSSCEWCTSLKIHFYWSFLCADFFLCCFYILFFHNNLTVSRQPTHRVENVIEIDFKLQSDCLIALLFRAVLSVVISHIFRYYFFVDDCVFSPLKKKINSLFIQSSSFSRVSSFVYIFMLHYRTPNRRRTFALQLRNFSSLLSCFCVGVNHVTR